MTFVACIVAVAPMRATASHRSEMVSQLLLGEFAEVLETTKDFTLIRTLYDQYEGWCQTSQLAEVDEAIARQSPAGYTRQAGSRVELNGAAVTVSLATPVYAAADVPALGKYTVKYDSSQTAVQSFNEAAVRGLSGLFLQVPYLWGGRGSFGIDCSGFTQQVYKMMGIALLRDASQQATQGEVIGFLQETRCGDLAFFDNEEGRITHVGILLNSEELIHSSGRVRIDKIDNQGIVNVDTGQRTHRLRLLKRITQ